MWMTGAWVLGQPCTTPWQWRGVSSPWEMHTLLRGTLNLMVTLFPVCADTQNLLRNWSSHVAACSHAHVFTCQSVVKCCKTMAHCRALWLSYSMSLARHIRHPVKAPVLDMCTFWSCSVTMMQVLPLRPTSMASSRSPYTRMLPWSPS